MIPASACAAVASRGAVLAIPPASSCRQPAKRRDRREALRLSDAFEPFERDVAEHAGRLLAHRFVRVDFATLASAAGSISLATAARRTRVSGSSRGDLRQQFALLERNLLDEAQADRGVDVLLTGLGAESIEQCHRRSSLTRAGQLVTRFGRMERRTPTNLEPGPMNPEPAP